MKQLQRLDLCRMPHAVSEVLFPLQFLPRLTTLTLNLDLPGSYPGTLADVPPQLLRLTLSNIWLHELPSDLTALTGEARAARRRVWCSCLPGPCCRQHDPFADQQQHCSDGPSPQDPASLAAQGPAHAGVLVTHGGFGLCIGHHDGIMTAP